MGLSHVEQLALIINNAGTEWDDWEQGVWGRFLMAHLVGRERLELPRSWGGDIDHDPSAQTVISVNCNANSVSLSSSQ